MHHGPPDPDLMKHFKEMAERGELPPKLGPTGRFPEGKLTRTDEGEIRIAIGHKNGKVVIDFGKEVAWIGFSPAQAIELANTLKAHALQARGG